MDAQIILRNDTAANWNSSNPTLASGEAGFETDTKKYKIGDGSTVWNSLAYIAAPIITTLSGAVSDHSLATSLAIKDYITANAGAGGVSTSDLMKFFIV